MPMKRGAAGIATLTLLAVAGCTGQPEPGHNMSASEVAAQLESIRIEPGLWEISSEIRNVSGQNLPHEVRSRMMTPRPAVRNCITPEQAAQPAANFLLTQGASHCIYRDFAMQGGRLTGSMTCSNPQLPGTMTTAMDGRYGGRSYDMRLRMETAGMPADANMTIEAQARGRRIGDCPAPTAAR
jgi:hypothetical protein